MSDQCRMERTMEERLAGTTCTRCVERRYPFKRWEEPYTCGRCREVLRGGALGPLRRERSPAQQAAAKALGSRPRRAQEGRSLAELGGVEAPNPKPDAR